MIVALLFGLESQGRLVSIALGSSSCRIVHDLSKLQIAGMVLYGGELIAPLTSLVRVRAPPVIVGDCGSHEMECFGRNTTSALTMASFSLNEIDMKRSVYDVSQDGYYHDLWMSVVATGGSGPCQRSGCSGDMNYYICTEPSASNCCQGADYTVKFCSRKDELITIINLGSELKSTDQLFSGLGYFTLGFFDTNYRYLGIWYTNDQSKKVWVANPNTPIKSTSGAHALSIEPITGNLIITVEGRTVMNIADVNVGPYTNLSAKLQDTGNFQLINNFNDKILWQSFDDPVNVLLPGMKLGYDMATGRNLTLTSWLTNEIPHSGAFTLSWEPTDEASQRLMIRRRGQPYWTSGNLVDHRFPYLVTNSNSSYNRLTSVYNTDEQYFSYATYRYQGSLPMWILTPDGKITITNVINSSAPTSEFCYGYDSGDGCVKESSLPRCRTKYDNFNKIKGYFTSELTRNDTDENSSLSISDCFSKSWNNCSCVGFESNTNDGTGCVLWTGNLSFEVRPFARSRVLHRST